MLIVAVIAVGWWGMLRLDRQERENHSHFLEFSRKESQSVMEKAFLETALEVQSAKLTPEQEASLKLKIQKASDEINDYKRIRGAITREQALVSRMASVACLCLGAMIACAALMRRHWKSAAGMMPLPWGKLGKAMAEDERQLG
jgi:hypothetical protein